MTKRMRSIKVRSRFLRSTRLDTVDAGELLDGFVLHETGEKILTRVIEGIQTGEQRAFTWTGAYGSGKSTLALYLSKILSSLPEHRGDLEPRTKGGGQAHKRLISRLHADDKPWLVISVVGQKNSVEDTLRREFSRAVSLDLEPELSTVDVIKATLEFASKKKYAGLLVVIDELGRHLEHAAEGSKSLHVLQEIAEIFARSKFPAGFVGLLHQAIHDYLPRTDRLQRQEWEKIQGRFADLLFGLSIEESILLISSAIDGRRPSENDLELISLCCGSLGTGRLVLNKKLPQHLQEALPLHPYTSVLLCLISRQRFGQNERSLFSFLASNEPAGLQEYARSEADNLPDYYTADMLFDYLQINLGRSIAAVEGLGQRWSDAEECVTRAEQIDDVATAVVKVISLAEVFGRSINLVATPKFLVTALPQFAERQILEALKLCQEKSVVEYRHFKRGYSLTLGSDIDLDAELAKLRANMVVDDVDIDFGAFANLKPVVAKKHYHKTGTQRYFDTRIVSLSRLNEEKLSPLDPFFDGTFLLFLYDDGNSSPEEGLREAKAKLLVGWEKEQRPILIGTFDQPARLNEQALELAAIKRLSRELPELQNDKVARRRLASMAQDAETELAKRITQVLQKQGWQHDQVWMPFNQSAVASMVSDSVYGQCPPVFNELVNRHKPSAAANKARRVLMSLMQSDAKKPNLGIEKSPPELGIYLSVIRRNGLYPASDMANEEALHRPKAFTALFEAAEKILRASGGKEILRADEILKAWSSPPFGVRMGVVPLLLMSFLMENRAHIAPYVDGRFVVEFDDLFVERLSRVPKTISLRWASLDGPKRELVDALAGFVSKKLEAETSGTPLDIARQLVHFAFKLPNFSKSYRGGNHLIQLSAETETFRAELLLADDPLKLLFEKIPKIFGVDLNAPDAVNVYLEKSSLAVDELRAIYPALIADLRRHIEKEFPANDVSDRIGSIRSLAKGLQSKTFDESYNRFIDLLSRDEPDDKWVEDVSAKAISKPVDRWLDSDITEAKVQIVNLAIRFRSILDLENSTVGNVVTVGSRMGDGSVRTGHRKILADGNSPEIKAASQKLRQYVAEQNLSSDEQVAALTDALQDLLAEQDSTRKSDNKAS